MIRRLAFISGLVLGSGLCAWALGSALTYLFTGKIPRVQVGGEKGFNLHLVDVHTLYEAPAIADDRPAGSGEGGG